MLCDLHTHSCYSDGTLTPFELVIEAEKAGLGAIALTDHNSVNGLKEFKIAAEEKNIEAVCGAEFSVDYNGKELHLLGLFIPFGCFDDIAKRLEEVNLDKERSNIELAQRLTAAGYDISYDELKRHHPNCRINRAHFAAALVVKGYVDSVKRAFSTLLKPENGYYSPAMRLDIFEMITYLRSIGAVPVLAHPMIDLSEAELAGLLPIAKKSGLAAMETRYSSYDHSTQKRASDICKSFGLLESGGSDFHGTVKPHISLGRGMGDLEVPYSFFEALKKISGR